MAWLATVVGAAAGVALGLIGAPASAATPCDRTCLGDALDRYLSAVIMHHPEQAALAPAYRETQNAAAAPAGAGVWQSASGLGDIQRRYFDPQTGQAAFFGILREGAQEDIASVRLKVANGQVVEGEWTVARPGAGGLFDIVGLRMNPPPEATARSAVKSPRVLMVRAANLYFEGLQQHSGADVPHVPGCDRIENGVKVTHRPRKAEPSPGAALSSPAPASLPAPARESRSGDCASGFEQFRTSIAQTALRRFPLIDQQQGVVMGSTVFARPAGSPLKRNLLTEFFYIDGGKISDIWASMYYLDTGAPFSSGW